MTTYEKNTSNTYEWSDNPMADAAQYAKIIEGKLDWLASELARRVPDGHIELLTHSALHLACMATELRVGVSLLDSAVRNRCGCRCDDCEALG